jgi:DNA-binding NarL/FixJ family response regulator
MQAVGEFPTRISAGWQFLRTVAPVIVQSPIGFCYMKIYIVEDAHQTRKRITDALASIKDFEIVGEAESVCDAKKGISSTSPETVILDISLPDGSGVEILKLIRKRRMEICVVVLTYDPSKELRTKCMELGAAAVFNKLDDFKNAFEFLNSLLPRPNTQIEKVSFTCN